uniref:Zinc finger BED domain-containing protein DAYSLEEPER-like n=1 Tax=Nelumbo nucifera TaxID=4432 RepID=A0A822XU29_NELNU|nr:TPA_asm: hypothetical protein HUJ06_024706 [Nelumbo nucifera]
MAKPMQEKFDKYWAEYSTILAIAVVLDPRYKLKIVEYAFIRLYGEDEKDKSVHVRDTLYELFKEYMNHYSSINLSASTILSEGSSATCYKEYGFMKDYDAYESQVFYTNERKSQLDLYLEEPYVERQTELNVIAYWKSCEKRFPELSLMARDILKIPISTVAFEAAFSGGRRLLNQYHSSLAPKMVEALICTRDWLFGSEDKAEKDDVNIDLEVDISNFESISLQSD